MGLADANTSGLKARHPEEIQAELEKGLIQSNPRIIAYPATNFESDADLHHDKRQDLLEPIFLQALARKCN